MLKLVEPSLDYFDSYLKALQAGYAYGTTDPYTPEKLADIIDNREKHITDLTSVQTGFFVDKQGTQHPKVAQYYIWIINEADEFVGAIKFRPKLNPFLERFAGHVGYSIVESFRNRGYATQALALFLDSPALLKDIHRPYIVLTTDPANVASQKVILANGGKLVEKYYFEPMQKDEMLYYIDIK